MFLVFCTMRAKWQFDCAKRYVSSLEKALALGIYICGVIILFGYKTFQIDYDTPKFLCMMIECVD